MLCILLVFRRMTSGTMEHFFRHLEFLKALKFMECVKMRRGEPPRHGGMRR